MDQKKNKCSRGGMFTSFQNIATLGIALGALLVIPFKPEVWTAQFVGTLIATGFGLAYVLLGAVDAVLQRLSLGKNPVPCDLDLSDRAIASERAKAMAGCSLVNQQARRLLNAWGIGASGPQVAMMAASQVRRVQNVLMGEAIAIFVVLFAAVALDGSSAVATLSKGLLGLTALVAMARFQAASQIAAYLEAHLLSRIGNDTPAAAASSFADATGKAAADSMKALADAQTKFGEQLVKAQADMTTKLAASLEQSTGKLSATLEQSTGKLAAAQAEVATQLGCVTTLVTTVESLLKLQESVDTTLKGVSATDEFKSTLIELKRHLAESDLLLKNATKPRTIRFVEKDSE